MLEIIIKRDKLPQFGPRGMRYYICMDGTRIDDKFFLANGDAQDYKVNVEPGNHKLTVFEISFQESAVPKDVLNYDFEATQSPQTVYLKYNKKDKNLYFTENGAEGGGKSGGGFFKFFK